MLGLLWKKLILLKRGMKISSAKTWLNWLYKWALWEVTNDKDKFNPLIYKLLNHGILQSNKTHKKYYISSIFYRER